MEPTAALQALLATEHAVIFGYGAVGAMLGGDARREALRAFDAHRARRDALGGLLRDRGVAPAAAASAYDLPALTTSAQALALAVRLEEGAATSARDVLGADPDPAARRAALSALTEAAVRAAGWRVRARQRPVTRAFPGTPA